MTEKKVLRKLKSLVGREFYRPIQEIEQTRDQFKNPKDLQWFNETYSEVIKAHKLFDKVGYTEDQRKEFWAKHKEEYWEKTREYNRKPEKRHVENPNTYGEKFPACRFTAIRKPRKCRKTAWKRFYKCFPSQDPEVIAKNKAEELERLERLKKVKIEYIEEELKWPYSRIDLMYRKGFITGKEEENFKQMVSSTDSEMFNLFLTIFEKKEIDFKRWLKKRKLKKGRSPLSLIL